MDSHLEMDYEDRFALDDDEDYDTWGWEAATGYEDGGYEDYEPSPYDGTYSEC
jgi:hypothetical protein